MNRVVPTRREQVFSGLTAVRSAVSTAAVSMVRRGRSWPTSVEEIGPDWLTSVLVPPHTGVRVMNAELSGRSDGTTNRARLALTYDRSDDAAELPASVFVKVSPGLGGRLLLNVLGMSSREAQFYRELRPHLPVDTPKAYGAYEDEPSGRFVIVLEDMSVRGAQINDARHILTREQAEALVDSLARLHGSSWENPLSKLSWLAPVDGGVYSNWFRLLNGPLLRRGLRRFGDLVPPTMRDLDAVQDRFWRQLACDMQGPSTVLHGDCHAGNLYFDGEGNAGFYDWQLVRRGSWAYDLGYCLISVLTVEQRRMWERDLLKRYLERLAEQDIADLPDEEQAWLAFRRQSAYGFVAWLETLTTGGFHDEDICREQVVRYAQAAEDHGLITDSSLWS